MNARSVYIVAAAFALFAAVHSLTVSRVFKDFVLGLIGETRMRAYYRLGFTVVSVATTALAGYVIFTRPDTFLYRPPSYILWPMHAVQFIGLAIFILSQMPFNSGYFLGIKQALGYMKTGNAGGNIEGIPVGALVTTGVYGLVRHPMYLGGILMFLFEPAITVNNLVLRCLAVGYFVIGGLVEDRRFLGEFGDAYRSYRQDVPMFNIVAGVIRCHSREGGNPGI